MRNCSGCRPPPIANVIADESPSTSFWNVALVTANALGATVYVVLTQVAFTREHRSNGVTPEPLLWSRARWVLVLFLIVNLVWAMAILARRRWRRWDLYVFVWLGWIVALVLGSGLASV
jgi:cell division protein FtsW (lipid II flippase)